MNPRPIAVQPLENYELLITFQNGEKRFLMPNQCCPSRSMPR